MRAVEFMTELSKQPIVTIPPEIAAQLPKSGRARVIVLTPGESGTADAGRADVSDRILVSAGQRTLDPFHLGTVSSVHDVT
jgi:hypothetical protein